jgi:hypothetical protein
LAPASANGAVLFDSTPSPPGFSAASQDFEAALNANDAQVADDFTVPPGQTWTIQRAFIDGKMAIPVGPGTSNTINIALFQNAGTLPAAVDTYEQQLTADPDTAFPDFTVDLPGFPALSAGTYWLGAQVVLDFEAGSVDNLWLWGSIGTARGNKAAYRNPGDGFNSGCTSFGVMNECVTNVSNPDVAFRLEGTCAGTCPVAATPPPRPKKCKKKKKAKKKASSAAKCKKKKKKKKK